MTNSMKYGRNQHSSINEIEVSSTIIINDENTSSMVPGQKVKVVHECEHCEAQYSQKGNEVFILSGQFTYGRAKIYPSLFVMESKLYTPSTPNIDLILWHTHWIVCAVKLITHDLIHDFHFTF